MGMLVTAILCLTGVSCAETLMPNPHCQLLRRFTNYLIKPLLFIIFLSKENPIDLQRKAEKKRAREARKRQSEHEMRSKSPPPVDGRRHQPVQTELYLEELTDRIEESDITCQTDLFIDRPPTPLFVPAKTGSDVTTQILPGDLFNFDLEVKVKQNCSLNYTAIICIY